MKLESCIKLACGRCETPENTIKKLEKAIGDLYEYRYVEEQVAEHLYWSALYIDDIGFRSMGKGVDPVMCKAGAFAEGAEWLTSLDMKSLPGYVTGYQDNIENPLKIEDLLVHVNTATPEAIERIKKLDCSKYWVDGYSLINDKAIKVPVEYVRRISGTSGLASGNTKEEALMHGMTEIFERRAHVTVLKNKLIMPTIDIETIDNPLIIEQIDFVKSKGIEVYLKDLSFGGELPCMGAYLFDPHIPAEYQFKHFFKVGSDFNLEEAMIRNFTEYSQGRRLDEFIDGSEEEQKRVLKYDFRAAKCGGDDTDNLLTAYMFGMVPFKNADFLKQGDLVPFNKGIRYDDCLDDINQALALFKKLGRDCIVVDYTDPEIGFPVMQTIVPGYSDVLPYHPHNSPVMFQEVTRKDVLRSCL